MKITFKTTTYDKEGIYHNGNYHSSERKKKRRQRTIKNVESDRIRKLENEIAILKVDSEMQKNQIKELLRAKKSEYSREVEF